MSRRRSASTSEAASVSCRRSTSTSEASSVSARHSTLSSEVASVSWRHTRSSSIASLESNDSLSWISASPSFFWRFSTVEASLRSSIHLSPLSMAVAASASDLASSCFFSCTVSRILRIPHPPAEKIIIRCGIVNKKQMNHTFDGIDLQRLHKVWALVACV